MSSIQTQNTSSGGRNNRQSTTWTNNNNNNANNNQSKPRPRPQGDCAELKHNVFDLNGSGAIDKFNKSLEALLNYITSNQTGGQDVVNMLDNDEEPDWMDDAPEPKVPEDDEPEPPVELQAGANQYQQMSYQTEVKAYKKQMKIYQAKAKQVEDWNTINLKEHLIRIKTFEDNCNKAYGLIWGQCTQPLKNKCEQSEKWTDIKADKSHLKPLNLLKLIKTIVVNSQDTVYPMVTILDSVIRLIETVQGETEGINNYVKRFKEVVDLLETQFGPLVPEVHLKTQQAYQSATTPEAKQKVAESVQEQLLSYLLIKNSKAKVSKELLKSLGNTFAMTDDKYPKTIDKAITVLTNYQTIGNKNNNAQGNQPDGATFMQQQQQGCFNCGRPGCWKNSCPMPPGFKNWPQWKQQQVAELILGGNTNAQHEEEQQDDDQESRDDQEEHGYEPETGNVQFGMESKKKKKKKKSKR